MKRLIPFFVFLLIVNAGIITGESQMIDEGKKVKFDYTLSVDGSVVESSQGAQPLEYTHGAGMIIPGLENALKGMTIGDEKQVVVAPDEGYGPVDPNAVVDVPKSNLGPDITPEVGMILQVQSQEGRKMSAMIMEIAEETLKLNFNHPLAGKELTFDVKIVEIQ